jgi:predicted CoA-binding protein
MSSLTTATDEAMRVMAQTRTIAVVGISSDASRPSYEVAEYLVRAGYEVYLVNPVEAGPILGLPVYGSLAELPVAVDLVDVFRRPEFVPGVVADAIAAGAKGVWTQLEIVHAEAAAEARAAGLEVVMDRCTKIEHQRLLASGGTPYWAARG